MVMRHGGDVGLIWWVSGLIGGPDLLGLGGDGGPAIHGFDLVGEWVLVVCIGGASATAVWLDWAGFGRVRVRVRAWRWTECTQRWGFVFLFCCFT